MTMKIEMKRVQKEAGGLAYSAWWSTAEEMLDTIEVTDIRLEQVGFGRA